MTDKKSRRVVIINNIKSDTIDQAIFILKNDTVPNAAFADVTAAAEAQGIIDSYIRQVERIKGGCRTKTKKAKLPALIILTLFALGILCAGLSLAILSGII